MSAIYVAHRLQDHVHISLDGGQIILDSEKKLGYYVSLFTDLPGFNLWVRK